jgi:hypothetical protein
VCKHCADITQQNAEPCPICQEVVHKTASADSLPTNSVVAVEASSSNLWSGSDIDAPRAQRTSRSVSCPSPPRAPPGI